MARVTPLVEALRQNNPKTNFFENTASITSYKTGFPVMDYYLGFIMNVFDTETDALIDSYPSLGISDGCFIYLIGKSSTGKTAVAEQMAANIVRPFENGFVVHYDLEKAQNNTRIQSITKFKMSEIQSGKYILRTGGETLSSMYKAITQLYEEKVNNPKSYKYDTGLKDEFGNPKMAYVPTCVIIDSIPHLITDVDGKKVEEVSTQTDRMRLTGEINRFYTELTPKVKEANIIVFSINHIKTNPGMGFLPNAPELMFLKQDEALPGGKGPYYVANYMMKLVGVGSMKYKLEDDGFDGFGVRFEIIKSRTNKNGQFFTMIYDMKRGFDPLRTTVEFAKGCGLISGNKNGYVIGDHKDMKFTLKNMNKDFHENRELYKILFDSVKPFLMQRLSYTTPEDLEIDDEMFDY